MKNFLLTFKIISFFLFFSISTNLFSKEYKITGNEYSDDEAISSLIGEIPDVELNSKINYIIKQLEKSNLFQKVEVSSDENFYYINIKEFPSINNIFYRNNERLKDEQIDTVVNTLDINILSNNKINQLIEELKNIYQSFGYNNIEIDTDIIYYENNTADLYLIFNQGTLTKIKEIIFTGNKSFEHSLLVTKIKSKTKTLRNIFANNNFKLFEINNDIIRLNKYYSSKGYKDVKIDFDIEYFDNNKVIVNFKIIEGKKYFLSDIKINNNFDKEILINEKLDKLIIDLENLVGETYNNSLLDDIEFKISNILHSNGIKFYEIKAYKKINDDKVDTLFEILPTEPIYINQINIKGNTRTFEYVIRREIDVAEGDPLNNTKLKEINKSLNQLSIFKNVNIENYSIDNNLEDIDINVEETQTGSFNVGLSLGTLDGVSFVSGLKEKNINGSGRSVEFLINTNQNNRAVTLSTTEKFFLNSKINHKYALNYNENNFSKSKSYKLNTLGIETAFSYKLADNFYHNYGLGYEIKDYIITDSSTVSQTIAKSSGANVNFILNNSLTYNTLNSYINPSNGDYLNFINLLQTPSSSSNGFFKNIITTKKYIETDSNIYSIQAKIGNIFSLNNSEILSNDKFSLGGKWLRGFDSFGAGPRNSRTDYVGGNNIIATKLDYLRPITFNEQNPIYLNLFNDYGLVWSNKNTVTSSDEDIRASYGFGFKYYSPIGPIGLTWGFPLSDKNYDIKRMFLFTIGDIN